MNKRKEIVFAVPGSKKYINDFYCNSPDSFINYSLTGVDCELNCLHCKKILLDTMNLFDGSDETIKNITESNMKRKLKGILISGGFDLEGKLPINGFLKKISMLKKNCPDLKILVHSGFTNYKEAEKLKESGIDYVLVNFISSDNAIKNVYNLKNKTVKDYINTIKALTETGNRTVPHIIAGIDFLKIDSEYESIEQIAKLNINNIVFAIVKKLDRYTSHFSDYEKLTDLIIYARKIMPDARISLGCANPSTKKRGQFEIDLIKNNISCISFPAEETIRFCNVKNIPYRFEEMCCAAAL